MHPAPAGGLRVSDPAELVEHPAQLQGDRHRVVEVGPGLRVEVDAQLVGMLHVGGPDRPWVEGDRAQLRRPDDRRRGMRADLVRRPARGEGDPSGADPVRRPGGDALLVEGLALEPLAGAQPRTGDHSPGPALQRGRPVAQRMDHDLAHRHVVVDDLELGDRSARRVGEVRLGRIAHPDLMAVHLADHRCAERVLRHPANASTRIGPRPAGVQPAPPQTLPDGSAPPVRTGGSVPIGRVCGGSLRGACGGVAGWVAGWGVGLRFRVAVVALTVGGWATTSPPPVRTAPPTRSR